MFNQFQLIAECRSFVLLFSFVFILQGCATMNQDECLTADWLSIGERDGIRGKTENMFESRASACAKHGITADRSAYKDGYNSGLREFCLPNNGYKNGLDKIEYHYVCPIDQQSAYLREYVKGLNLAISELDFELRKLDIDYRSAEISLNSASTEDEIKSAEKRLRRLKTEVDNLDYEYDTLRNWLNIAIGQM